MAQRGVSGLSIILLLLAGAWLAIGQRVVSDHRTAAYTATAKGQVVSYTGGSGSSWAVHRLPAIEFKDGDGKVHRFSSQYAISDEEMRDDWPVNHGVDVIYKSDDPDQADAPEITADGLGHWMAVGAGLMLAGVVMILVAAGVIKRS